MCPVLAHPDRVLVMDSGRPVETGSSTDLIAFDALIR